MISRRHRWMIVWAAAVFALAGPGAATPRAEPTNSFVVATYNVENWLSMSRRGHDNQPKPSSQREIVWHVLETVRADVLALEEIGTRDDLASLAEGLRQRGLEYPWSEWIEDADHVRHIALLSRFPIVERHSRTNDTYQIHGSPLRIQRGIIDVTVEVNPHYRFRALVAHLKSKRPADQEDESAMRQQEARLLREHVDRLLRDHPRLNLLVLGDFNDTPASAPVREVVGGDSFRLFDLKAVDRRGYTDTHYWWRGREFSRIDYLLASPGMSNEFVVGSARLADLPHWLRGSDHRAVHARFYDCDLDPPDRKE